MKDFTQDFMTVILAIIVLFAANWSSHVFYDVVNKKEASRVKLLYEGDAEWIAVDHIENENIILKKKLDDLQAHYDSMVCYRPGKEAR